jgi:hypothetical protein
VNSRVGKSDDEGFVVVADDAGVAGLALFAGGIAAAVDVAAAESLPYLRMADYYSFAAAGPADSSLALAGHVRSWAFVAVGPRRKGWRAWAPWRVGKAAT